MLAKLRMNGEAVIVTGGGAGIGKAAAAAVCEMGATSVIVGRTEATLRDTRAEFVARGWACEIHVADVSREDDVRGLARWAGDRFGNVKAVVNNAGDNFSARLHELGYDYLYYENIDGGHAAAANLNETAVRNALEFTYLTQRLMD